MTVQILQAYLVTFGWAIVGSLGMGTGIALTLKLFDLSTPKLDEWALIKEGNIAMAIVLAAVILSLGIVVSSAVRP
ncbi:MAG: DUF350 domain-containing protein [Pirellulales bacterium]